MDFIFLLRVDHKPFHIITTRWNRLRNVDGSNPFTCIGLQASFALSNMAPTLTHHCQRPMRHLCIYVYGPFTQLVDGHVDKIKGVRSPFLSEVLQNTILKHCSFISGFVFLLAAAAQFLSFCRWLVRLNRPPNGALKHSLKWLVFSGIRVMLD